MVNKSIYQILAFVIHKKIYKSHIVTLNLKYHIQHGMKHLNYLTDNLLYQIFKIISSTSSKKYETVTDNSPIRIYVNKMENRITLKIKKKQLSQSFNF